MSFSNCSLNFTALSLYLNKIPELGPTDLLAFGCSDVLLDADHIVDRFDGHQVYAHYEAGYRHGLGCHLQPSSWSCAKVDQHSGRLKEIVLSV